MSSTLGIHCSSPPDHRREHFVSFEWLNHLLCDWLILLSHALESYTALPFNQRKPCPPNPIQRPAYQGSNPISDVWSRHALHVVAKYMKRYKCRTRTRTRTIRTEKLGLTNPSVRLQSRPGSGGLWGSVQHAPGQRVCGNRFWECWCPSVVRT